jgi:hypothetical protein
VVTMSFLDRYGMADPDNNEDQPEDRCNVCEEPVVDHPCWTHPRKVIVGLILGGLP